MQGPTAHGATIKGDRTMGYRKPPTRTEVHEHLLPVGAHAGDVEVRDIIVTDDEAKFARIHGSFHPGGRCGIEAGAYRALYRAGTLWMSDTPDEWNDQRYFVYEAVQQDGPTLLTGLGLGMTPTALILAGVPRIDIVEIDPDVCELVGGHLGKLAADRGVELVVHNVDAFTWKVPAGLRWDSAFHDIWPTICGDNVREMARLRSKFSRRMTRPKAQWCWCEHLCKRLNESGW